MRAAVVDAAVAVKWVPDEEQHAASRTLLGSALHAPDHRLAEALPAVLDRARRGERSSPDAAEAARPLTRAPVRGAAIAPLATRAYEIGAAARITAHDAFHAALAKRLGVPLVTADRRLPQRLSEARVAEGLTRRVGDLT